MDLITTTPGLIHIAEQIFSNLDRYSLLICQKVNVHWASILQNPWFWLNRTMQKTTLSQEHQKEWIKFCEKLSKLDITEDMAPLLNYIYGQLEDSVTLNETYWFAISMSCRYRSSAEIVRIMAPLIENPNALEFSRALTEGTGIGLKNWTPIYWAAGAQNIGLFTEGVVIRLPDLTCIFHRLFWHFYKSKCILL